MSESNSQTNDQANKTDEKANSARFHPRLIISLRAKVATNRVPIFAVIVYVHMGATEPALTPRLTHQPPLTPLSTPLSTIRMLAHVRVDWRRRPLNTHLRRHRYYGLFVVDGEADHYFFFVHIDNC